MALCDRLEEQQQERETRHATLACAGAHREEIAQKLVGFADIKLGGQKTWSRSDKGCYPDHHRYLIAALLAFSLAAVAILEAKFYWQRRQALKNTQPQNMISSQMFINLCRRYCSSLEGI